MRLFVLPFQNSLPVGWTSSPGLCFCPNEVHPPTFTEAVFDSPRQPFFFSKVYDNPFHPRPGWLFRFVRSMNDRSLFQGSERFGFVPAPPIHALSDRIPVETLLAFKRSTVSPFFLEDCLGVPMLFGCPRFRPLVTRISPRCSLLLDCSGSARPELKFISSFLSSPVLRNAL